MPAVCWSCRIRRTRILLLFSSNLERFARLYSLRRHTRVYKRHARWSRGDSERNCDPEGDTIMVDQEVIGSQLKSDRFPFQSEGDITLAVRNADYSLGPVMLHIVMKPKAVIPAHVHKGMAEALYVVEGDFINEGKQHQAGTSLHFTVRTLPKMAANCSSSGRMESRKRLPISATLSSPKRQLSVIAYGLQYFTCYAGESPLTSTSGDFDGATSPAKTWQDAASRARLT